MKTRTSHLSEEHEPLSSIAPHDILSGPWKHFASRHEALHAASQATAPTQLDAPTQAARHQHWHSTEEPIEQFSNAISRYHRRFQRRGSSHGGTSSTAEPVQLSIISGLKEKAQHRSMLAWALGVAGIASFHQTSQALYARPAALLWALHLSRRMHRHIPCAGAGPVLQRAHSFVKKGDFCPLNSITLGSPLPATEV